VKALSLLELAAAVADRAPSCRKAYRLAAVAVRTDGLLVSAFNVQALGQKEQRRGHAEYRLHSKLTSGSVVGVARVNALGEWAMAKPCVACETLLRNRRVRVVYYTIAPDEYGVLNLDE